MGTLEKIRTLVLNDDFSPLTTVSAKKAIKRTMATPGTCDLCNGRGCSECGNTGRTITARVVEYYDVWIRDSKNREYPVPAVISNNHHVKRHIQDVPYSRTNVFRRDDFTCQYCGVKLYPQDLTLDHVVPRSMWKSGSPTCFTNVVTCCVACNRKKDNKTPEQAGMQLRRTIEGKTVFYKRPKTPRYLEIVVGRYINRIPHEWEPYLAPIKK